jgi:hypothetical protein
MPTAAYAATAAGKTSRHVESIVTGEQVSNIAQERHFYL